MTSRTVRYRYRAYPTKEQELYLSGLLGAVRVVFNDYVYQRERAYKAGNRDKVRDLSNNTDVPETMAWMKEYPSAVRQQAVRDAMQAYSNFFASLKGESSGSKVSKPRYKKKRAGGSMRWAGEGSIKLKKYNRKWAAVRLPKEQSWVKFRLSRELASNPTSVTLSQSPTGQYYVTFVVEQKVAEKKTGGPAAGVDVGLIDLVSVVQSDGQRYKIEVPKNLRLAEKKLARAQQKHARAKSGSKNREKARHRVASLHSKVGRTRQDQHRKIAHRLADENQAVGLESLALREMASKKKRMGKSFQDAGLGLLTAAIENACARLGSKVVKINRFEPTSQTCSVCRIKSGKKALNIRVWDCVACGARLDRDYNAAVNILLAAGHAESLNVCGGDRRLQLAGAFSFEAETFFRQTV